MKKIISVLCALAVVISACAVFATPAFAKDSPGAEVKHNVTVVDYSTGKSTQKINAVVEGDTITLKATQSAYPFTGWVIDGKYEIVSGTLGSRKLVVRPLTDIIVEESFDVSGSEGYGKKPVPEESGKKEADVKDGKAEVTLKDGTKVTATGIKEDGLKLIIVPVVSTDTASWNWYNQIFKNVGTKLFPFDVYFVDQNDKVVEVGSEVDVSVTLPQKYATPLLYKVESNGKLTLVKSTLNGNVLTFKANSDATYCLAEKATKGGKSAKTGNDALALACLVACGAFVVMVGCKKSIAE